MNILQVNAVACNRRGSFDAEVQLKWGDFEKPYYKQVLVSRGHASSREAIASIKELVSSVENAVIQAGLKVLADYPDAQD